MHLSSPGYHSRKQKHVIIILYLQQVPSIRDADVPHSLYCTPSKSHLLEPSIYSQQESLYAFEALCPFLSST